MTEKKVKNKMTLDKLATIIQSNFLGMEEKIEKIEKEVKLTRNELKSEIDTVKTELKADIKDIKADLNKKVDIFTHKDLEYRVEKLEEKAVVGRKK